VYVAHLGMMKNKFRILVGKYEEKDVLGDLAYCTIIFKRILKERVRGL
jgi:hypothetical protein